MSHVLCACLKIIDIANVTLIKFQLLFPYNVSLTLTN